MMAFARMFNKNNELIFFLAFNEKNPKLVRAAVTNEKSLAMFDLVWAKLKEIPADSQEADFLIAGMAVRAMVWQDFSDQTNLYPQKEYLDAHQICFGQNDPAYSTPEEKLDVFRRWGHAALVEKTLEFDGRIPIFDRPEFITKLSAADSSFVMFTKRFDKYHLVAEEKAEVKSPSPMMMYGEY